MNIVDHILFQCRFHPPTAAICAPGTGIGLISYGRLEQSIHNISRRVISLGLSPGNIVAIYIDDPIFHAAVVLAFSHLGIITFSGRPQKFPTELHVDAVIVDSAPPFTVGHRIIIADLSWTEGDGTPIEKNKRHRNEDDDSCRIVLTSGTTGDPKAVPISHKMLFDRIGRHHAVFGHRLPACSRIFSDLSLTTSLGFQFLIYTLWRGGTFFWPSQTFENSLQAMEYYKVQCCLTAPGALADFLSGYERYNSYQSRLQLIISAGDLLSKQLADRVRARICSNLISVYGSTEAGVTATAPVHAIDHMSRAVGYITPGVSVEIINENGDALPLDTEGVVRIRSTFGVHEYCGNPAGSEKIFRNGWFYPGDIGAITTNDVLLITGREHVVLNVGGDKLNPQAIEEVLVSLPNIDQAAVFTTPNELGIEIVSALIVTRSTPSVEQLKAQCSAYFPQAFVPVNFIQVDAIPRNAMGKIDRLRLPEAAKGLFRVL